MALIVSITGSPSSSSRTQQLVDYVHGRLRAGGHTIERIAVRELPAEDLLQARLDSPALVAAIGAVERADAVVVATPIYKAAYTGVLKLFLDLLPQLGFTGKVVLPLATGGTLAHVLAIDYGLRPVLQSLNAQFVLQGLFILDKLLVRRDDGTLEIEAEVRARLDALVSELDRALAATRRPVAA
jgi:FMN reductase